jgi:hypothetical protein
MWFDEKISKINGNLLAFPSGGRCLPILESEERRMRCGAKYFALLRSKTTTHPPHSGPPSLAREG